LNKINLNTDFLFSTSSNGIESLEQKRIFAPLNISENKLFSDLNYFSVGNKPQLINNEFNCDFSDYSFNSFEGFQPIKKLEMESDYSYKKIDEIKIEEKNDMNKFLQNDIPLPFMNKYDIIQETNQNIPMITYGDYNLNYNSNEKILENKEIENENENELTYQNSGIFYNIHKRKINKFRKKLKFLLLPNKKKNDNKVNKDNKEKNEAITDTVILKKFNDKSISKNYKYKCEHPGCTKTFRTMKLKLNRHDLSESNCKKDTIILLYMINDVKKLLKIEKRKNNARINRLKKIYKKCILNLAHRDYAINIAGNNLIN
jgi:hypothetical protein